MSTNKIPHLGGFVSQTVLKALVGALFGNEMYYESFADDFMMYNESMSSRAAGANPNNAVSGETGKRNIKNAFAKHIPGS